MALEPVTAIAQAIAEFSKTLGLWMASADKRKMTACINAGEMYIRISEMDAPFQSEKLTTQKRVELLAYWKKKFYQYNQ